MLKVLCVSSIDSLEACRRCGVSRVSRRPNADEVARKGEGKEGKIGS